MDLKQLKNWREKNEVSLTQLAAESGLLPSYLSQLEGGSVQPLDSDKMRIEDAVKKIEKEKSRV